MNQLKNNKESERNPLARTMTIICIVFALIMAICKGSIDFWIYESDMMNRYQSYTRDVLNYVVREIDGDDLYNCMVTRTKSEKYHELQKLTNDLKETHKLEFLYIIQPISENPPDNMMDVLAAYTQAGKDAGTDGLTDLGNFTGDLYPPEVAREYLARMDKNPEVTFFMNSSDFGNMYTAIRPIFNSKGEPIAVICADVLTEEINEGRSKYIKMSIFVTVLAGAFLILAMAYWLKSRVADPIKRIRNSAKSFAERCHDAKNIDVIDFEDPNITTNDEIEDLAIALSSMCADMKAYTEELLQADREKNDLKAKVVKMDSLAYKDALTGAGNKAAYEKFMAKIEWDIISDEAEFTILMADLNYLKRVNDNFGHDKGNEYLMKMYEMLCEFFPYGKIFRIGGDEFVIIVTNDKCKHVELSVKKLKHKMKKILKNTELEPWERVSAAIGISHYEDWKHMTANDVFLEADKNMYADKKAMRAGRE